MKIFNTQNSLVYKNEGDGELGNRSSLRIKGLNFRISVVVAGVGSTSIRLSFSSIREHRGQPFTPVKDIKHSLLKEKYQLLSRSIVSKKNLLVNCTTLGA